MSLERPTAYVSTGELPPPERVRALVDVAYERFVAVEEGEPSRVYPALAEHHATCSGYACPATTSALPWA